MGAAEETRPGGSAEPTRRSSGPFRTRQRASATEPPVACRFLALETAHAILVEPRPTVDARHRCLAMSERVPQSTTQQQFVCLTAAHVNCPRFVRGVEVEGKPAQPATREPMSPAVIGSALVLAAALAASVGFLAVRGGFGLAAATPSSPVIVAVASPSPSASPGAPGSSAIAPSPSASSLPLASIEPSAAPPATPAPTPTRTPAPASSSDRYALLTACPSTPNCWIYVVRTGDNLHSIANYFGVNYSKMMALNPSYPGTLRRGYELRIPTPTR